MEDRRRERRDAGRTHRIRGGRCRCGIGHGGRWAPGRPYVALVQEEADLVLAHGWHAHRPRGQIAWRIEIARAGWGEPARRAARCGRKKKYDQRDKPEHHAVIGYMGYS